MLARSDIRIAVPADHEGIAAMSRDYIEHGLGWSWTPERVLRAIRSPSATVLVVQRREQLEAFAIMEFGNEQAHLSLLAVHPMWRHLGLGAGLLAWLEQSARVAGIGRIRLEARADNHSAAAFYARLGFSETGRVPGYYEEVVDAVQLEKKLA